MSLAEIIVDGAGPKVRDKYPLPSLGIGDSFLIANPRPNMRGCLYNRAEVLEIRITVRKEGARLRVRRFA